MAQAILMDTKLRLVFEVGMDEEGAAILKSKTFNNIKKDSTPEQIYMAAQAIAALCSDHLNHAQRLDSSHVIA